MGLRGLTPRTFLGHDPPHARSWRMTSSLPSCPVRHGNGAD